MTASLVSAPIANADGDIELSPAAGREVFARINRPDFARWATQVTGTGGCSHPVRLVGSSTTVDTATGEVMGSYASATEPDRVTYVRCGNRRADVCPSCSTEYAGDLWHQLSAGMVGGKGVPEEIRQHPLVFATLTAPSFGAVHGCSKTGRSARRCRPRSPRTLCPHGRPTWCQRVHSDSDADVGQPLCSECYDYTGHVVWQWWAPELWRRFTITLRRHLAQHLGLTEKAARDVVRVQFAKVAEYQRRGLIHFHALIRLDGPPTDADQWPAPKVDLCADELCDLVRSAAAAVHFVSPADGPRLPSLELRFGVQVDARIVHDLAERDDPADGDLHPETVAAYIAKYATKATATEPGSGGQAHLRRIRKTVDQLGRAATREPADGVDADRVAPYGRLGRWADALGFRGRFGTASRAFSVTLTSLREARRDYKRERPTLDATGRSEDGDLDQVDDDTTLVVGSWRFVGMGWLTNGDAALAADTAARAREHRLAKAAARRVAA
ncbi:MAG TPA: replication initiator [Actinopolymorphaceae bacterium]|jgi:hypothetical protein